MREGVGGAGAVKRRLVGLKRVFVLARSVMSKARPEGDVCA